MPFRYQELLPLGLLEDDESLAPVFGSKPITPEYPTSEGVLSELLGTNKKLLPQAVAQAGEINKYNQESLLKALRESLGMDAVEANKEIGTLLRKRIGGDIGDLASTVFDKSAAKALESGYAGSGMAGGYRTMDRNLKARDLGLTQYDVSNKAISSFLQWSANARNIFTAPTFDVANFQFSIPQQMQMSEGRFARDVLAANIKAAPNPSERGRFETNLAIGAAFLSAYSGGMGGGGDSKPSAYPYPTDSYGNGSGDYNEAGSGEGNQFSYFSPKFNSGVYG